MFTRQPYLKLIKKKRISGRLSKLDRLEMYGSFFRSRCHYFSVEKALSIILYNIRVADKVAPYPLSHSFKRGQYFQPFFKTLKWLQCERRRYNNDTPKPQTIKTYPGVLGPILYTVYLSIQLPKVTSLTSYRSPSDWTHTEQVSCVTCDP